MKRITQLTFVMVFLFVALSVSANGAGALKIAVIGDTGIGDRSFNPGFKTIPSETAES